MDSGLGGAQGVRGQRPTGARGNRPPKRRRCRPNAGRGVDGPTSRQRPDAAASRPVHARTSVARGPGSGQLAGKPLNFP